MQKPGAGEAADLGSNSPGRREVPGTVRTQQGRENTLKWTWLKRVSGRHWAQFCAEFKGQWSTQGLATKGKLSPPLGLGEKGRELWGWEESEQWRRPPTPRQDPCLKGAQHCSTGGCRRRGMVSMEKATFFLWPRRLPLTEPRWKAESKWARR